MDVIPFFFLGLCCAAIIWNIATDIRIVQRLQKGNIGVSMAVMRYMPWIYVNHYKQITKRETGKPGPLYYHFTASVLTILVTGIATLFLILR